MPFVSLDELARFMRAPQLASGSEAELLQEHLEAALEQVAAIVGPPGEATTSWDVYMGATARQIVLPATHLQEVVAITAPDGSAVTLDARRDVNALAGIVTVPRAMQGTWTIEGRTRSTTASVKLAVKIIAQHLWGTQRGTGGGRAGMFAQAAEDVVQTPVGFAIPRRAAQLLEPYTVPHELG